MGDVAEAVELGRDISRAAAEVVFHIIAVDAEIGGGAGHELSQAIGPDRAFGGDVEAALLLDQGLKEAAPLGGGEPRAGHTGCACEFASDLDDHHLDGLAALAEKAAVHRARISVRVDRRHPEIRIAFEGADIEAGAGDGRRHLFEDAQLVGLDVSQRGFGPILVLLDAQILGKRRHPRDGAANRGIVLRRHALGMRGQGAEAKTEPGGYDRGAAHSERGRGSKVQSGLAVS